MKIQQYLYKKGTSFDMPVLDEDVLVKAQLVLVFAASKLIKNDQVYKNTKEMYPEADIVVSSASGAMFGDFVYDDNIAVTAIYFKKTQLEIHSVKVTHSSESFSAGVEGVGGLPHKDLQHILVFSEGNIVNGDQLAKGAASVLPNGVRMSGGLAGGGLNFESSYVSLNRVPDETKQLIFIGLYGKNLQIGTGSCGGWDNFGPKRLVTKSKENIVYELDGKPALDLYELYLGDLAKDLPITGVLFPMSISNMENHKTVVRTLIDINRDDRSIVFAGDIPEGCYTQLMKANFDRLIDGSIQAGEDSMRDIDNPDFALLVSCMGRRAVLKQRIEEEIEVVRDFLGKKCETAGFYSYGEIGPSEGEMLDCQLHNQTMTVTVFKEI